MSQFTLQPVGGALLDVLSGSVTLTDWGPWLAHLELGEESDITGLATLFVASQTGDPTEFHGAVIDGGPHEGRQRLVVMGGTGGLLGPTTADHERTPTDISGYKLFSDLIAAAGEAEASDLAEALSGLSVARWSRTEGEIWELALGRAAQRLGVIWRVLDSGAIWAGLETWPEAELDGIELDVDTTDRKVDIAYDIASARPGTTVGGRRIHRVDFTSEGRGALHFEP